MGLMGCVATHVRMSSRVTKLVHQRLPADVRIGLWAGKEPGMAECGCGHKLEWANHDQVGQLQWHMFACTLPEETNVRRRWLQTVRRDIASPVRNATWNWRWYIWPKVGACTSGLLVHGK